MFKYIKSAFFVIVYAFIYLLMMLLCQVVFGLTIGGAGKYITDIVGDGARPSADELARASEAAYARINEYVTYNTGIIFAISALLSLLVFVQIFKARKIDLLAVIRMGRVPQPPDVINGAFAGASSNFIVSLVLLNLQNVGLFKEAFSKYDAHINMSLGAGGVLALMLGVGLVVPVVEEVMFRGMVMYEAERAVPLKAALVVQGLLFGLFHMEPVQICYTVPLGIYFGYVVYKSNSLYPAVAAHVAMNSVAVVLTVPEVENAFRTSQTVSLFFAGASFFMFVSSLTYFITKKKPDKKLE